jgi:hypothetical protein
MHTALLIARLHARLTVLLSYCLLLASILFGYRTWIETAREAGYWALVAGPLLVAAAVFLYKGSTAISQSDALAKKYGLIQALVLAGFVLVSVGTYFLARGDGLRGKEAWLAAMTVPAVGPIFTPPVYLFLTGFRAVFERLGIRSWLANRFPWLRRLAWTFPLVLWAVVNLISRRLDNQTALEKARESENTASYPKTPDGKVQKVYSDWTSSIAAMVDEHRVGAGMTGSQVRAAVGDPSGKTLGCPERPAGRLWTYADGLRVCFESGTVISTWTEPKAPTP